MRPLNGTLATTFNGSSARYQQLKSGEAYYPLLVLRVSNQLTNKIIGTLLQKSADGAAIKGYQ